MRGIFLKFAIVICQCFGPRSFRRSFDRELANHGVIDIMTSFFTNNARLSSGWALGLAVIAGAARLLANVVGVFNAAPVAASATYAGARLRLWQALLLPLGIMVATDLAFWMVTGDANYSPLDVSRAWVYPSFMINAVLGMALIRSNGWMRVPQIGAAALLGSVQFFVITNFGAWLDPRCGYPQDTAGLLECYTLAIPFWQPSVVSDLLFTFGLFGIEALAVQLAPAGKPIAETTGVPS